MKISEGLLEVFEDNFTDDYDEYISLRDNYSGKWMFGDTCLGFDVQGLSQYSAIARIQRKIDAYEDESLREEFNEMLNDARQDDMGKGIIIYFPHYTI